MLTLLFLLGLGVLQSGTIAEAKDCTTISATPLGNLFRRSSIYAAGATESLVDDQTLKPGWYSTGNYDMVLFAPEPGYCGTNNQIWMNASLPDVNDGIQPLVACQADIRGNCSKVIHNQIINCGTYRLYHLTSTDFKSAYCFDPAGLSTATAIHPAPSFQPKSAQVAHELVWEDSGRGKIPVLKFKCQFDTMPSNNELQYIVFWYIDGVQIPLLDPVTIDNLDKSSITEHDLNHLGVTITCSVRVRRGAFGKPNSIITSPGFFAGIKVRPPVVSITRGGTAEIVVEPTVPFGCYFPPARPKGACTLPLRMYDPGASYKCDGTAKLTVANALTCGTLLEGISEEDVLTNNIGGWKKNYTLVVTTASDTDFNMKKQMYSVYLTTELSSNHKIWDNYKLKAIPVTVSDANDKWKGKICYAHVDPHMKSADGRRYESQDPGEYVFYRHKTLPMEVQYKTKACNRNRAQCACAVSIRAGGDLFIIDRCRSKELIDFVSCSDNIIDVLVVTEKQYKVTLPIGTVIVLTFTGGNTMNIDMTMTAKDFNAIEGLCGRFNGDWRDDFTARDGSVKSLKSFTSSWLVDTADSLLAYTTNPVLQNKWPQGATLCVCHGNKTMCSGSESVTCESTPSTDAFKCRLRKDATTKRRRRWASVPDHDDAHIKKRAASDAINPLSMADAIVACENVFKKHPGYALKDKLTETESLDQSVHECALDLNMTGDTSWAAAHLDTWVDNSVTLISRNNTFRSVSAVVAQEFEEMACPRSCNGNGNCANGTCDCHDHFIAADCSIDTRTPPRIDHTDSQNVCDWTEEDCCDGFPVYGDPFVKTTKCTIQQSTIYTDGSRVKSEIAVVPAQFRSSYEVLCPTVNCSQGKAPPGTNGDQPFVTSFEYSVSNDGLNFGQILTVTVYDSTCQELINDTKSISFVLKAGYCFIDQTCVLDGMNHLTNNCFYCDREIEPYSWTRNTGCDQTSPPSGDQGFIPNHHRSGAETVLASKLVLLVMATVALGFSTM